MKISMLKYEKCPFQFFLKNNEILKQILEKHAKWLVLSFQTLEKLT